MTIDILYFVVVLGIMTGLAVLMGTYLAKTFTGTRHWMPERWTYRLLGIDPDKEDGWKGYALALVLSNGAMMLVGYALLRLQLFLPLNPLDLAPQDPDLAFNTAASFITNTNWQSYAGETLSNFSQMAVITFLMFVGAATGVAACAAFIRGLSRKSADTIGNFWVDLTRVIYRVFAPICFFLALFFVWQGMPQTLDSQVVASTLEGTEQAIRIGPVASLETIKHIGTNGGGFFGMNAAHPYENPTPLTNVLHILSMLLIPSALTYAFGSMLLRRRQGWVFFGAFMVLFVSSLTVMYSAEQYGNPLLAAVGVQQDLPLTDTGGSMEGKELRFGISDTSLFAVTTTSATTGSVNAMHDSLTPLGGGVTLWGMMLNTVWGGDGVG
ncbi:MAG: potassium-transporting ATPase subunit KdpA, partial [Nitrococcus sp.]|nr:potassium-transporting ATPase subunit KdpA [Nitrococcus sp.]